MCFQSQHLINYHLFTRIPRLSLHSLLLFHYEISTHSIAFPFTQFFTEPIIAYEHITLVSKFCFSVFHGWTGEFICRRIQDFDEHFLYTIGDNYIAGW